VVRSWCAGAQPRQGGFNCSIAQPRVHVFWQITPETDACMATQRRVASAKAKDSTREDEEKRPEPSEAAPAAAQTQQPSGAPAILPSAALNIGAHSVLMLVVPLGLFFASSYGLLDRKRGPAGGWRRAVPREAGRGRAASRAPPAPPQPKRAPQPCTPGPLASPAARTRP
jgi:hypothetical protein